MSVIAPGTLITHVHAAFGAYSSTPSDKLPVTLVSIVVPEHAAGPKDLGKAVGTAGGITVDGVEGGVDAANVYVASKPTSFADESEVNTTYNWPVDDGLVVTPALAPVRVLSSGADDDTPSYTLTKS